MSLLTFAETCAALKVSPPTLRQLIASGQLKAFKVGAQWRVRSTDLEAYVKGRIAAARSVTAAGRSSRAAKAKPQPTEPDPWEKYLKPARAPGVRLRKIPHGQESC